MQYLVYGVDRAGVGHTLESLAEDHWDYMDQHTERLVARGPTLTSDGATHTGSVHVIEAAGMEAARRFAFQEPYWLAGVYASVTVTRFQSALDGTMWDRPRPASVPASTLMLTNWATEPMDGATPVLGHLAAQQGLIFGGLLVSEDATCSLGLVTAWDLDVAEAESVMANVPLPTSAAPTVSHRWQRGGRHQAD